MIIHKYFTKFSQNYAINLRADKLGEITISRNVGFAHDNTWQKAKINWPGCGEQSIDNTQKFSDALKLAYYLAGCLDNSMEPDFQKNDNIAGIINDNA